MANKVNGSKLLNLEEGKTFLEKNPKEEKVVILYNEKKCLLQPTKKDKIPGEIKRREICRSGNFRIIGLRV